MEPVIQVSGLGYQYPKTRIATLNDLTFSVNPGEVYGFLGPSGAGKSTTQKVLYKILQEYRGSVLLMGRELRSLGADIFRTMGIGFETPNLYSKLTGRENVEFALELRGGFRTIWSERISSIQAGADRLGIGNALDNRVQTYSKGMKMRLAFLRAVIHQPKLLFLDEPTSGLDPLWQRVVKDWILELKDQGTAVFLTTHSMELADELCDRVGFLVDGRIVAQDRPEALKAQNVQQTLIIRGLSQDGQNQEHSLSYEDLRINLFPDIVRIQHIESNETSLEKVFIQLTGRKLDGGT